MNVPQSWHQNFWILLLAAILLSGCSPLRLVSSLSATNSSVRVTSAAYGPSARQQLDIYLPEQRVADSPVIVFFYGGSWKRGDRAKYSFVGHSLGNGGYVAVIPDYRLYPEVSFPAFVEDGAQVLDWVKKNVKQADHGIVVMGHSAGAHTAALLALDRTYVDMTGQNPDIIRGMIGLAGPYGFDPQQYRSTRPIFANTVPIDKARPVTFACSANSPLLLLHGEDDGVVIPENSRELKRRVVSCGGKADYVEFKDINHFSIVLGLSDSFLRNGKIFSSIDTFLRKLAVQQQAPGKTG